ncbi:MAG: protein kinase [Ignavibacteria bacterium]|nr:protein kinase [Ignavibacteria bacterium]
MIGREILNYRIVSLIGEGGMGSVYLAKDKLLDRRLAIKILNPHLTKNKQFIERFILEAKILSRLEHENIVRIVNFFDYEGNYYMVMTYAEGITLKDLINQTGPIIENRALKIFIKVCESLEYAHSSNIVHRDIKPENIIIDDNDNIKILDFGIAKIIDSSSMTRTGTKMGTLYYMSPEQIKADKNIDSKADIYSLGIVLYEMLTGALPFNTKTNSDFEIMKEIVEGEFRNPKEFYPYISNDATDLILMMTYKDKSIRIDNLSFCKELAANILSKKPTDYIGVEALRRAITNRDNEINITTDCSCCHQEINIDKEIAQKGEYVCPNCKNLNSIDKNELFNHYCLNCNNKVMFENELCDDCVSNSDLRDSKSRNYRSDGILIIKPAMFRQPFSFSGRIRRTEYGLSIIMFYIASILISLIANDSSSGSAIIALILYVPIYWFLWAQGAKRCHDLGNNGFYQIIPFYVLWLIFTEGGYGENKYGQNPKGLR